MSVLGYGRVFLAKTYCLPISYMAARFSASFSDKHKLDVA